MIKGTHSLGCNARDHGGNSRAIGKKGGKGRVFRPLAWRVLKVTSLSSGLDSYVASSFSA
jgi:hypothetical protein